MVNYSILGKRLARTVFALGEKQTEGRSIHRLQFLSGSYPDNEYPEGGLCETALADVLSEALQQQETKV